MDKGEGMENLEPGGGGEDFFPEAVGGKACRRLGDTAGAVAAGLVCRASVSLGLFPRLTVIVISLPFSAISTPP